MLSLAIYTHDVLSYVHAPFTRSSLWGWPLRRPHWLLATTGGRAAPGRTVQRPTFPRPPGDNAPAKPMLKAVAALCVDAQPWCINWTTRSRSTKLVQVNGCHLFICCCSSPIALPLAIEGLEASQHKQVVVPFLLDLRAPAGARLTSTQTPALRPPTKPTSAMLK